MQTVYGIPIAISAVLILGIDLVAELFPIAALGWDPPEGDVMSERPRNPKDHILNRRSIIDLALSGLLIGVIAYANYLFYFDRNGVNPSEVGTNDQNYLKAVTLTYLTIVACQFANILLRRSSRARTALLSRIFGQTKSYLWPLASQHSWCF